MSSHAGYDGAKQVCINKTRMYQQNKYVLTKAGGDEERPKWLIVQLECVFFFPESCQHFS